MGTARLITDVAALELPLGASTRIGRHWSCDGVLALATAPLHWIELRWRDDHWSWRPLGAAERTRGTGAAEPAGFRSWASGDGRARLDGCGCTVELRLVDASAPASFVEDLTTRERFGGAELQRYVERWSDGRAWPLGIDPAAQTPLHDGDVFVLAQRAYRMHEPGRWGDTAAASIDVRDRELAITIDVPGLRAVFTTRDHEVAVIGECVRVLAVYAEARHSDADGGGDGWMSAVAAHQAWIEHGGRPTSAIERLAWERGKLRTRLAAQGVCGLEALFGTRGAGPATEIRVALEPSQLELVVPARGTAAHD